MNNEIVSQLRDVHWPPPPSLWPLAGGYYIVLVLVVFLLAALLAFFKHGRRRRSLKKLITQEVGSIERVFERDKDVAYLQAAVSALLQRIVANSRLKSPDRDNKDFSLYNALVTIFPDQKKTEHLWELLHKDRFQKQPDVDGELLIKLVREQTKRCRI